MMEKYRKKQVVIEAVQFTDETKDQVYNTLTSIQGNVYPAYDEGLCGTKRKPVLKIPTREGVMEASLGDWIIIEPNPTGDRRLYPCKPDIFAMTYEKVGDSIDKDALIKELVGALKIARGIIEALHMGGSLGHSNIIDALAKAKKAGY